MENNVDAILSLDKIVNEKIIRHQKGCKIRDYERAHFNPPFLNITQME